MTKWIQRKYWILVNKGSQQDIPSQADLVNLIRVKRRTSEIKTAKRIYHLPVEEEEEMIAVVAMRNWIKENHSILNLAKKFLFLKETLCKNKMKIEKG